MCSHLFNTFNVNWYTCNLPYMYMSVSHLNCGVHVHDLIHDSIYMAVYFPGIMEDCKLSVQRGRGGWTWSIRRSWTVLEVGNHGNSVRGR